MLPYIIAAGVGYLINELVHSEEKPKKDEKKFDDFFVFVRSDDFGKASLVFYSFEDAKAMYDKIAKSGKVKYRDFLDNSEFEKKHYDEGIAKGWTKDEHGLNNPSDTSLVSEIAFGKGDDEFQRKEF
jgi:hypothetical protein